MKIDTHVPRRVLILISIVLLGATGEACAQLWIGSGFDGLSQQYYLSEVDTNLITPDSLLRLRQTATELNESELSLRTRIGEVLSWDQTTALTSISWHHQSTLVARSDSRRRTRGRLQYRLDWKSPHDDDEASALSDFTVHEVEGQGERALGDYTLRLSGSGQWVHYPDPQDLAYDYRHYRAAGRLRRVGEGSGYQEGELAYVRRDVPDSARVSYREASAAFMLGFVVRDVSLEGRIEAAGRRYDAGDAHIDFSVGRLRLDWRDLGYPAKWSGSLEVEGYNYYDPQSPISDYVRVAAHPRRAFPVGRGWMPYFEPGIEAVFARVDLTDENYFEPRIALGSDYLSPDGLWFSGDVNVSYRDYRATDQEGLTDYWRFGLNLLFDGRLWQELSASLLVSQDWEWHHDSSDDISLSMISAGLHYRFF